MNSITFSFSRSDKPAGLQILVLNFSYFDKGTAITPSFKSDSIKIASEPNF